MGKNTVTFGLFSDLHLDIMHDGTQRLDAFMRAVRAADVDFIVQLGDFCYPEDTTHCECSEDNMPINLKNAMRVPADVPKLELLRRFNNFAKPHYHVLGNHEFDFCSKAAAMRLYKMERPYYSFCSGEWKFVVLDANHFKNAQGKMMDYFYGNYFDSCDLPYIDREQMEWLEQELLEDARPTVIFSHQPLNACPRGVRNADELTALFRRANSREHIVHLCMNGHTHLDALVRSGGVYYYTVNSMSNCWVGPQYERERFSQKIERAFPNLRYTLPYEKPLFIIVTLDETGVRIEGRPGVFIEPGPHQLGLPNTITASIQNRELPWLQTPCEWLEDHAAVS